MGINHPFRSMLPFCALLICSLFAGTVFSQQSPGSRGFVPTQKPAYKDLDFTRRQDEDIELTPVLEEPEELPESEFVTAAALYVERIEVRGNTLLDEQKIDALVKKYEKRTVRIDELHRLRQELSLAYFELGYLNSGVVLPDQEVNDGIVMMQVVEGRLTDISVTGNENISNTYIFDRLNYSPEAAFNVNALQEQLKQLQASPLIRSVHAELSPGRQQGEAVLQAEIIEDDDQSVSLVVDNYRSPSIGAEGVTLGYKDLNTFWGIGDTLVLSATASEGLKEGFVQYSLPIGLQHSFSTYYDYGRSEVVEEPFKQLDIESKSNSYGLEYRYTFPRYSKLNWAIFTGADVNASTSYLLGEPFSFSAGAINGKSKSFAVSAGVEMTFSDSDQALASSLAVRRGLDALDSNINEDDDIPDSDFVVFVGQFQFAQRFEFLPSAQLAFNSAVQKSVDPLLSIDKFSLGGVATVRGYRENQLVRDNGGNASLEFRAALFGSDRYSIQAVPFLDWGVAWDEDVPSQNDKKLHIYSAGIGLEWRSVMGLMADIYWGKPLESDVKADDGDDLQDEGIHFGVGYEHKF